MKIFSLLSLAVIAICLAYGQPQVADTRQEFSGNNRFYLYAATIELVGERQPVETRRLFRIDTWTGAVSELATPYDGLPEYWSKIPEVESDYVRKAFEERKARKLKSNE